MVDQRDWLKLWLNNFAEFPPVTRESCSAGQAEQQWSFEAVVPCHGCGLFSIVFRFANRGMLKKESMNQKLNALARRCALHICHLVKPSDARHFVYGLSCTHYRPKELCWYESLNAAVNPTAEFKRGYFIVSKLRRIETRVHHAIDHRRGTRDDFGVCKHWHGS